MINVLRVIRWEIVQALKNKLFVVSAIVIPIILHVFLAPVLSEKKTSNKMPYFIGVLDKTGLISSKLKLSGTIDEATEIVFINVYQNEISFQQNLKNAMLQFKMGHYMHALIVFDGSRSPEILLPDNMVGHKNKIKDLLLTSLLVSPNPKFNRAVQELQRNEPKVLHYGVFVPYSNFMTGALLAITIIILFFSTVTMSGNWFIRGFNEEKNSRLLEVLLCTLRTREFLLGKFIGLCFLSIFQNLFILILLFVLPGDSSRLMTGLQHPAQVLLYFILGTMQFLLIYLFIGWKAKSDLSAQMSGLLLGFFALIPMPFFLMGMLSVETPVTLAVHFLPLVGPICSMATLQTNTVAVGMNTGAVFIQTLYVVGLFYLLSAKRFLLQTGKSNA